MLTTQSTPAYAGLVLIEPTMITEDVFRAHFDDRMATMEGAVCATSIRRDRWAGRDDARSWLSGRFPWRVWDNKVLDIYVVSNRLILLLSEAQRLPRNTDFGTTTRVESPSSVIENKKPCPTQMLMDISRQRQSLRRSVTPCQCMLFGGHIMI